MDASMSLLTLGERDLAAAGQFYVDDLGWALCGRPWLGAAFEVEDDLCFIKVGVGLLLGLWNRDALTAETGGLGCRWRARADLVGAQGI